MLALCWAACQTYAVPAMTHMCQYRHESCSTVTAASSCQIQQLSIPAAKPAQRRLLSADMSPQWRSAVLAVIYSLCKAATSLPSKVAACVNACMVHTTAATVCGTACTALRWQANNMPRVCQASITCNSQQPISVHQRCTMLVTDTAGLKLPVGTVPLPFGQPFGTCQDIKAQQQLCNTNARPVCLGWQHCELRTA
jgi:hypothetical protein